MYMNEHEADIFWRKYISDSAKGFHDLPGDCWVLNVKWETVGNWVVSYNGSSPKKAVSDIVREKIGWNESDQVYLIASKKKIATMPLKVFDDCWDDLLSEFDDSPVLIAPNSTLCAFSFVPLGSIRYAQNIGEVSADYPCVDERKGGREVK